MRTFIMQRAAATAALLTFFALFSGTAFSFTVMPVRLHLSGQERTAVLTVKNTREEPMRVQVKVLAWSQKEGKDVYDPTNELLITPPLFTVKPGAKQLIRLGLRTSPNKEMEKTYRIILMEVPPQDKEGQKGVRVLLNMSIPVFVKPLQEAKPSLLPRLKSLAEGKAAFSLTNRGKAHGHVISLGLTQPEGKALFSEKSHFYLLPGQSRTWTVDAAGSLHITAQTDSGDIDATVAMEK